jgi:hypothetical protein
MHDISIDRAEPPVVHQARVATRTLASLPIVFTKTA